MGSFCSVLPQLGLILLRSADDADVDADDDADDDRDLVLKAVDADDGDEDVVRRRRRARRR